MEITTNQGSESLVVRELTEKNSGNVKYFLLSNGNIRAEIYADVQGETYDDNGSGGEAARAYAALTQSAASETLNLNVTMYGFEQDLSSPLSSGVTTTFSSVPSDVQAQASVFSVTGTRDQAYRPAFMQIKGRVPAGATIVGSRLYLCTGTASPVYLAYGNARIMGNSVTCYTMSRSSFTPYTDENGRYWATLNVALSAGASIELNYSLLPNYVSYMSTPVYTVLSEAAMRPKLVVEYTLPADTSHDDAADVGANLLSSAVEEKEQSYIEGDAGAAGEYGVNVRTGRLIFGKTLFSLSGNKMPANLELCYNKTNALTRKINTDDSAAKAFDISTHMPKGFKLDCQQYVFPYGNDYVYVDGKYNYHRFALAQNASDVYFDTAGTGLLLYVKADGFEIKDNTVNRMTFNGRGLLVSVEKKVKNNTISMTVAYDADESDKVVSVTDGMGRVTQLGYAGSIVTVTKPDGNALTLTMNSDWRLAGLSESDGTSNTYAYNSDGVLESAENSAGERTVFGYDGQGRVSSVKSGVKKSSVFRVTSYVVADYSLSYLTKTVSYRYADDETTSDKIINVYEFDVDGKTARTYEALSDDFNSYGNIQFKSEDQFEHFVHSNSGEPLLVGVFETGGSTGASKVLNGLETTAFSLNSIAELPKTKTGERYVFSATAKLAGAQAGDLYQAQIVEVDPPNRVLKTLNFEAVNDRNQYLAMSFTILGDINRVAFKLVRQASAGTASFSNIKLTKTLKPVAYDCLNTGSNIINVCGQRWSKLIERWSLEYKPNAASSSVVQLDNVKLLAEDFIVNQKNANDSATFDLWYNGLKNCIHNVTDAKFFAGSLKHAFDGIEFAKVTFEDGRAVIDKTIYSVPVSDNEDDENSGGEVVYGRTVRDVIIDFDDKTNCYLIESYSDFDPDMLTVRKKAFNDVVTEYFYDAWGNVTEEKTFDAFSPDTCFKTEYAYSENGGFLSGTTSHDLSPASTEGYTYTLSTGAIASTTSPRAHTTHETYAANNVQLAKISSVEEGTENKNSFTYENGLLKRAYNDEQYYEFAYNDYNEVKSVRVGSSLLLEKTYEHTPQKDVVVTKHANGNEVRKTYDKYDRLVKVEERLSYSEDFEQKTVYIYSDADATGISDPFDQNLTISANSSLRQIIDKEGGKSYTYDSFGRLTEIGGSKVWYDEKNRLYMREVATPLGVVNASRDYADNLYPDEPDRTLGSGAGQFREDYVYDSLNRLKETKTEYGSVSGVATTCSLKQTTAYNDSQTESGSGQYASGLVKTLTVRDGKKADSQPALSVYTLEYDAEGNAVKVTHGKPHAIASLGTSTEASYEYDKLNRLTRENNQRLGKTWTYGYDAGGNITSKKEYAYATTELDNAIPIETQEYVYRASGWKDQLVSFGGEEITYDASGNPTGYRGATLSYEGGRRLKSYKKATDANAYEFTFDEDNLRLTKKHKEASGYDKTWTYWHTDGKLWGERITEKVQVGNFGILFWQDKVTEISYAHLSTGLAGFTVKEQVGTAAASTKSYLFRKNALGDVDAIYDTDMSLVGEYIYDAWGNCTIETTGTDNYAIMQLNPFRYRGYYWDKELNLYYLQTRYYDPETGRFINADNVALAVELGLNELNGLNLYSYCFNNPVNEFDKDGLWSWKKFWKGLGLIALGIAAVLVSVATLGAGTPLAISIVAGVTIAAGTLTTVNGISTVIEAGTNYNFVRDGVFQGNEKAYNIYENVTRGIAAVGSAICGGFLASGRGQATKIGRDFLGKGYKKAGRNRWVSKDGLRQMRFDTTHHLYEGKVSSNHFNFEFFKGNYWDGFTKINKKKTIHQFFKWLITWGE